MSLVNTPDRQCAPAVMMIRPVRFLANPQTMGSNAFQREAARDHAAQQARALEEFEGLAAALVRAGVEVLVFDDPPEPHTPDAIFPNNWVSFHADGRVALYPRMAENRRTERRRELIDRLADVHGFKPGEILDFSHHEADTRFLEGTGSLVLDRVNRLAYACLSPRTDAGVLADFAERLGYEAIAFTATGPDGRAIYHTNVLMSVGDGFAVICAEALPDPSERERVLDRLRQTGHEIVTISFDQLLAFAGNMLALSDRQGGQVLAMSERAERSLSPAQRQALSRHARLVAAPIPTIEDAAGGSVRCMLAEVFLPR